MVNNNRDWRRWLWLFQFLPCGFDDSASENFRLQTKSKYIKFVSLDTWVSKSREEMVLQRNSRISMTDPNSPVANKSTNQRCRKYRRAFFRGIQNHLHCIWSNLCYFFQTIFQFVISFPKHWVKYSKTKLQQNIFIVKLDGEAPVDNRPSTD